MVATQKAKTSVSFKGKAKALPPWNRAGARLAASMSSSSTLALEFVGKKGPVGLELFKLGFLFGGPVPKNLSGDTAEISVEDAWDSALSNDI